MEILPAIDIQGGKCVRLRQGEFADSETYADDPVEFARQWADCGATRLHVVDLDGARLGSPQNLETIRRICSEVKIPVQLGGGIRNSEIIEGGLEAGVDRVILGTRAAKDYAALKEMVNRFGEKIVLGIDAKNGKVAISGWVESMELNAYDFARDAEQLGVNRIIFTDISRDGMLEGINFQALGEMLNSVRIPVIASGGVGSMADIEGLLAIVRPNLEGVIVGKALYTGRVDLREAIRATMLVSEV